MTGAGGVPTGALLVQAVRILGRPGLHDVLIEDGTIARIEPEGSIASLGGETLDGRGLLAIPGLCNAHLHGAELPLRGCVGGLPQELYHAHIHAMGTREPLDPDDVYARTLATCVEHLQNGTTMAVDDLLHASDEHLDAVVAAYSDAGMRARIAIHLVDQPWTESVPFLDKFLTNEQRRMLECEHRTDAATQLDFCERGIRRARERGGLVGCIIAPSAPQRCSDELLAGAAELAKDLRTPLHVHVQETLLQSLYGPLRYGSSMLGRLEAIGALGPLTTVIHGVWFDDPDIELLAAAGGSLVHNPASNLRLGSGIAPVRRLLRAGVNVALGCDGYTCNDGQDMFDAMRLAGLLSTVCSVDFDDWLTPDEALHMATEAGARANVVPKLGRIDVGWQADLTLLDLSVPGLRPLNEPATQVVYGGCSSAVHTVIVAGRVVLRAGEVTTVNVKEVLARADEVVEKFERATVDGFATTRTLLPALEAAYRHGLELIDGESTVEFPPRLGLRPNPYLDRTEVRDF